MLVANDGSEEAPSTTLSVVDAATMVEIGAVETGEGAHGIVVDPSGRTAYVTKGVSQTCGSVATVAKAHRGGMVF